MTNDLRPLIEQKIAKQNGLLAAVAVSFWIIPIIALWCGLFLFKPAMSSLMIPISAAMIALMIRFVGSGITGAFKVLAISSYLMLLLFAFGLGIAVGGPMMFVVVLILILAGMLAISTLTTVKLSRDEDVVYFRMVHGEPEYQKVPLKNHWLVLLLAGLLGSFITGLITSVALLVLGFIRV